MAERTLFETEAEHDRTGAAALLRELADDVEAGRLSFDDGALTLSVTPPVLVETEVDVTEATGGDVADEYEVDVELVWEATDEAAAGERQGADDPTEERDTPPDAVGESAGIETNTPSVEGDAEATGETKETPTTDEGDAATPSDPQSLGQFEVFRDRADEWRWRLVHRNGNVIATSGEGYTRKRNARKGLQSVKRNAPGAAVVEE